jgi:hypothetical protein
MEDDAEKQDIFIVKETGKFIINDLEMQPKQQPKKNLGKRTRIETTKEGSDLESSVGDNVSEQSSDEEGSDNGKLKNKLKQATKRQKISLGNNYQSKKFDQKGALQAQGIAAKRLAKKTKEAAPADGHIVKYSGSAYKSGKGEGDTLKAGKYEPFAYIQLNPKMLNKRNKTKAIKSFEGIVSHGKKLNKRKGGNGGAAAAEDGMLSGINYKK